MKSGVNSLANTVKNGRMGDNLAGLNQIFFVVAVHTTIAGRIALRSRHLQMSAAERFSRTTHPRLHFCARPTPSFSGHSLPRRLPANHRLPS